MTSDKGSRLKTYNQINFTLKGGGRKGGRWKEGRGRKGKMEDRMNEEEGRMEGRKLKKGRGRKKGW